MRIAAGPSRRALLMAGMGLATAAAAPRLTSVGSSQSRGLVLDTALPTVLGPWRQDLDARPVLPDEQTERSVANTYDSWLARVYERTDGARVMFVLAYGDATSQTIAIHRPETCYSAQGFTVRPLPPVRLDRSLARITAARLVAVRDDRIERVLFWMTIAGQQRDFGIDQNLALVRAAWKGLPADGVLVRASTIGGDDASSFAIMQDFLGYVARLSTGSLRSVMGMA